MPFRVFATPRKHRQPSLFGELLDWMLAPLLILWPISLAIEYSVVFSVANAAYDRELRDSVVVLARNLSVKEGRVVLDGRDAARQALAASDLTAVAFQVRGLQNEVLEGDPDLPAVDFLPDMEPQSVYFRDQYLHGREVRVAYMFAQVRGQPGAVLVQLAETDEKRALLASNILSGLLAAQFMLVPLALVLVWFGLAKGIAPLNEMRQTIRTRRPQDLSPINPEEAPEEVRPFIHSINDLMQRLSQSLRAQQRFVADAAHQMRTPLAGLKTQAELALRQRDPEGIEHTMRQIAAGADRASRLINQLLALAGTEGESNVLMQIVDLDLLAQEVTREWVPRAQAKRIDIGYESRFPPANMEGNRMLLRECLNNLIDNAIRYTPEGGRVTTRVACTLEVVMLEVQDDGIGIDPPQCELVFERFYRVLGNEDEGSGLGLAIVREIAHIHRGSVSIVMGGSERGTLLRAVFPRASAEVHTLRSVA